MYPPMYMYQVCACMRHIEHLTIQWDEWWDDLVYCSIAWHYVYAAKIICDTISHHSSGMLDHAYSCVSHISV